MNKKVIALILSCVMLVSASPVVTAEDTPVKPTVEEILNEYHQKAFEAQAAEATDKTTTYSNRSGSKTLEQETVDTLNAAGYEAYNVTAANYSTLEAQLKTDFVSMGLDPNGSYIVVISGEDSDDSNNTRAFGDNLITPMPEPGEGGSTFEYTYEGATYTMRYVTVTPVYSSTLTRQLTFGVEYAYNSSKWGSIFNAVFTYVIDSKTGKIPVTTIASLLSDIYPNSLPAAQSYHGFVITGATTWTLRFIEVYDGDEWFSSQCSEYAITTWEPTHYVYNASSGGHDPIRSEMVTFRTDSEYYGDMAYCKELAAEYFSLRTRMLDFTGNIRISLADLTGETFYITDKGNAFQQYHWSYYDYDIL
jgi:hypothetical protein